MKGVSLISKNTTGSVASPNANAIGTRNITNKRKHPTSNAQATPVVRIIALSLCLICIFEMLLQI